MSTSRLNHNDRDASPLEALELFPSTHAPLSSLPDALKSGPKENSVSLVSGQRLVWATDRLDRLIIPVDCILGLALTLPKGHTVEMALIGPGGIIGGEIAAGYQAFDYDAVVHLAGRARVIPIAAVDLQADHELNSCLLGAHRQMVAQMTETIRGLTYQTVHKRLAKWLTRFHALRPDAPINLSHETLAQILNVRRPGVSVALAEMEGEGLLRSNRMSIEILDVEGLAAYWR